MFFKKKAKEDLAPGSNLFLGLLKLQHLLHYLLLLNKESTNDSDKTEN